MNKAAAGARRAILLTGLALCAAITASCSAPAPAEPPLQGARIGAPLDLVNQDGKRTGERDFAGRYRIVYFGYTTCPDVCPVDVANLIAGYKRFVGTDGARRARLVPIFVTVDPERDTPAVLRQYVRAFDPALVGLTGTPAEIATVAKGFAVYYNKVPGSAPDRYLMAHSQTPYLMGPAGEPIALLPVDDPKTGANEASSEAIAAELAQWVR